jgi:hypothetical protein
VVSRDNILDFLVSFLKVRFFLIEKMNIPLCETKRRDPEAQMAKEMGTWGNILAVNLQHCSD